MSLQEWRLVRQQPPFFMKLPPTTNCRSPRRAARAASRWRAAPVSGGGTVASNKSFDSLGDIGGEHAAAIFTVGKDFAAGRALHVQRREDRPILDLTQFVQIDAFLAVIRARLQ